MTSVAHVLHPYEAPSMTTFYCTIFRAVTFFFLMLHKHDKDTKDIFFPLATELS